MNLHCPGHCGQPQHKDASPNVCWNVTVEETRPDVASCPVTQRWIMQIRSDSIPGTVLPCVALYTAGVRCARQTTPVTIILLPCTKSGQLCQPPSSVVSELQMDSVTLLKGMLCQAVWELMLSWLLFLGDCKQRFFIWGLPLWMLGQAKFGTNPAAYRMRYYVVYVSVLLISEGVWDAFRMSRRCIWTIWCTFKQIHVIAILIEIDTHWHGQNIWIHLMILK